MCFALGLLLVLAPTGLADEEDDVRSSVLGVGDFDGDGVPDVLVASRSDGGGPSELVARSGRDARELVCFASPAGDPAFGRALAAAGDLDRDGFVDVLVAGSGCVYALNAKDGLVLFRLDAPADLPEHLAPVFGHAIAGGRDLDADGFPDLAVSTTRSWPADAASVSLHAGPAGALLGSVRDDHPSEEGWGIAFGLGLQLLPDLDGDGGAEVAISVARGEKRRKDAAGLPPRARIDVRNAAGELLRRFVEPEPAESWTSRSRAWALRVVGDLDGDGRGDLALAAPSYEVSTMSLETGATLWSRSYAGGYLHSEGSSLDAAGDVDGDGRADLLVAANETGLDCDQGWAWILSGRDGAVLHTYDPGPEPPGVRCALGVDAAAIGDVDADGVSDVAVHVPRAQRVEILSGRGLTSLACASTR